MVVSLLKPNIDEYSDRVLSGKSCHGIWVLFFFNVPINLIFSLYSLLARPTEVKKLSVVTVLVWVLKNLSRSFKQTFSPVVLEGSFVASLP